MTTMYEHLPQPGPDESGPQETPQESVSADALVARRPGVPAPPVEIAIPEDWIGARPSTLDALQRLARGYVQAGMMPRGLDSVAAATMVLLRAIECRIPFGQMAQWCMMVNGRLALWGDLPMALVMRSGLLADIDEHYEGEGESLRAVCTVTRRGMSPHTRVYSVADARRAGLWDRGGPWKTHGLRMLQMRARAFALRDRFADVLGGLDIAEHDGVSVSAQSPEEVEARVASAASES